MLLLELCEKMMEELGMVARAIVNYRDNGES